MPLDSLAASEPRRVQGSPRAATTSAESTTAQAMGEVDVKDVPVVALCLAENADGVWSHDNHFLKRDAVAVWTTKRMVERTGAG